MVTTSTNPQSIPEAPGALRWRMFRSPVGSHVLIVPHTRVYDIPEAMSVALDQGKPSAVAAVEALAQSPANTAMDLVPLVTPQAISLNVSSTCNLACSYCFAGRGGFEGRQATTMTWETARAAVDRLLTAADPNAPITVGFLGGEPFLNRRLIHRVVRYAAAQAVRRHLNVRFSVTTNGTVLTADDIALLREHPFAVTVSIDGGREVQDVSRPSISGTSTYDRLRESIRPLLACPGRAWVAARATVTRTNLDLRGRFRAIVDLGFSDAGLSPVRAGPSVDALRSEDWPTYLTEMVTLGREELSRAIAGKPIRLTNLAVALKQVHRGASQPYPCGAGGGYFSVASDGTWYACHRAIGQEEFALGDSTGLDAGRRLSFLQARHVHAQPACRTCWARYLCSGGCHHEASARSDSSCGFIRGWLDFCLAAYCELSSRRPEWFHPE